MMQGGARKVRKRLAAHAMKAKDLAAEALDEAKVHHLVTCRAALRTKVKVGSMTQWPQVVDLSSWVSSPYLATTLP